MNVLISFSYFLKLPSGCQRCSGTGCRCRCRTRAGLPAAEALAVTEDGRYAQAVREEQQIWLDKEVHAVPAFLFNEEYMVSGAQEAEAFVRFLNQIQEKEISRKEAS